MEGRTDSAPVGAAARAPSPKRKRPDNSNGAEKRNGGWVGEAARAWEVASGGTAPAPGRIGKALKPLVVRILAYPVLVAAWSAAVLASAGVGVVLGVRGLLGHRKGA